MTKVIYRKQDSTICAIFPENEVDGQVLCYNEFQGEYRRSYDVVMKNSHPVTLKERKLLHSILENDLGYDDLQVVKRRPTSHPITIYYTDAPIFRLYVIKGKSLIKIGEGLSDKVENVEILPQYKNRISKFQKI